MRLLWVGQSVAFRVSRARNRAPRQPLDDLVKGSDKPLIGGFIAAVGDTALLRALPRGREPQPRAAVEALVDRTRLQSAAASEVIGARPAKNRGPRLTGGSCAYALRTAGAVPGRSGGARIRFPTCRSGSGRTESRAHSWGACTYAWRLLVLCHTKTRAMLRRLFSAGTLCLSSQDGFRAHRPGPEISPQSHT